METSKPIVLIPASEHSSAHLDFKSVEEFGQPIFLFTDEHPEVGAGSTDGLVSTLNELLDGHQFDPDRDYIAATGSIVTLLLLGAVLGARTSVFKILIYSSGVHKRYFPRIINVRTDLPTG